jgi:hypothetical protein
MCECEVDEPPKVFERRLRLSRGDYHCCECAKSIPRGAWYEDASGLWDESWNYFRTCLRCVARREAFHAIEGCWPALEELRDTIVECMRESDGWAEYGRALRKARVQVREHVASLESARAERYRLAGVAREERKRALACLGEGI